MARHVDSFATLRERYGADAICDIKELGASIHGLSPSTLAIADEQQNAWVSERLGTSPSLWARPR